jgi:uncharacterized protein (TIGR01777 family)
MGGTGMIGRALTSSLIKDGHQVIILSRNPGSAKGMPPGTGLMPWDGRTAQGWGHLVNEANAIINLAGASLADGRWTKQRKREIFESRVQAGEAVAQAVEIATRKPKVLVQASAVGYYGPHEDEVIPEEAPPGDDFPAEVCLAWEASTAPVEELGVRRVLLRTGVVLDSKEGALPRMLLPFKLFVGGPLGTGRQWFPWIHIADEVGAIRYLVDNDGASGPFNLTAPNPLTNADFSKALGRALGRPSVLTTPAAALCLLFGVMSTLLLDGQRAVPTHLDRCGYRFQFPTVEAALQDLLA